MKPCLPRHRSPDCITLATLQYCLLGIQQATEALASLVGNVGGGGDTVVPTSTLPFARVPVETLAMLADRILVRGTVSCSSVAAETLERVGYAARPNVLFGTLLPLGLRSLDSSRPPEKSRPVSHIESRLKNVALKAKFP